MVNIGETARLVQPVIQGEVMDTRFNKDANQLEHLVSYPDAEGDVQERWFLASDLEVVK